MTKNHRNPFLFVLIEELAGQFGNIPIVEAVALGGSSASGITDRASDIDLYVFSTGEIPLSVRQAIIHKRGATRTNLNLKFWDSGDAWIDAPTGIEVDILYWDIRWVEDELSRILQHHQARLGYSTCLWHTLQNAAVLFDRSGWLRAISDSCQVPYPEALRQAIIQLNYPVLRDVIPAYIHQLEKSIQRDDRVSINHRTAALLASYFDIIFAINRIPHPGEKRLLEQAMLLCPRIPEEMSEHVDRILQSAALAGPGLLLAVHALIDGLAELLVDEGFELS